MEIRGWCCSSSDSIQLGVGRGGGTGGNHHRRQQQQNETGCCGGLSTISTRRAKWRRLMRQKMKRIFDSSSQVMVVPVTSCSSTAASLQTTGVSLGCGYDRWSYEQNFDKGSMMWDDEEERDNIARSFSMRFAQCPSSRDLTVVVHRRQGGVTEQATAMVS